MVQSELKEPKKLAASLFANHNNRPLVGVSFCHLDSMLSHPIQQTLTKRTSLLAGVLLLLLTIGIAASFVLSVQSNNARERLERDLRHRADVYEAFLRTNLFLIDQALQALRAEIVEAGVPTSLRAWVNSRSMLREPLFQFAVADRQGRMIASSEFSASSGLDLSDRRHIRIQLDGTADRIYFSEPLIGRASGRLSINVTRPVIAADGTVVAVVITSVDPKYFSNYLNDFSEPASRVAQLVGGDGVTRATSDQGFAPVGRALRDPVLLEKLRARVSGVTRAAFGIEGHSHLVAHRPVNGYDLSVVVGLDARHLDATFASEGRIVIGYALLMALLVLAMGIAYDRISSMNADASAIRARSEERRSQLERMGALLSDCEAVMLRVDAAGRVLEANPAFRRIFQMKSGNSVASGSDPEGVDAIVSKAISAPRFPFRASGYAKDENGARRDFIWSWIKLQHDAPNGEEYLGVAVDHTELRQKELMLIHTFKLSSLGRQSAAICHELAQPLNVVSLGLDNLRRDIVGGAGLDRQFKRLDRLTNSVRRAGRILDRFRSLARAPSRPLEILNLRKIVLSAIDSVIDPFSHDGVRVEFRATCDPVVLVNGLELEQVFVNILTNAADSIVANLCLSEKSRLVAVSLDLLPEGDRAEIKFRDTGGGLPQDLLTFGVRPFYSTKEKLGGIGLGLAISDATIRSLGGELRFKNVEDGAVFTVSLPVQRAIIRSAEV
jgi:signal transduction histidine kinase